MAWYFDLRLLMLTLWTTNVAAKSVCYPTVGCFDTHLPCNVRILPQSPEEINTQFFLYTPENTVEPQMIDWKDDASIVNSNFQGNRGTKFIIHGFTSNIMLQKFRDMKNSFLSIGNFNVILVNWKNGADLFDLKGLVGNLLNLPLGYEQSRQNTRLVGRQIAELSRKLQILTGASFASMHLIGHSLGAQLAGFAGEHLSGQYGRITGLDPAGPGYQLFSAWPGCLLEKSDAKFVDIIHTDGILGNQRALGHQDFYPNGGLNQAGCAPLDFRCDHGKAVEYFTESITSKCSWLAYPCSSWIKFKAGLCRICGKLGCSRMGYYAYANTEATGSFMLGTNSEKPYCKEDSGQPSLFLFF